MCAHQHVNLTMVGQSSSPIGFECAQPRRTPRTSVERIRRKALLPFGLQHCPALSAGSRRAARRWSSIGYCPSEVEAVRERQRGLGVHGLLGGLYFLVWVQNVKVQEYLHV